MAWGSAGTLGAAADKTAATTVALTTSAAADAGNYVVVVVAIDNTSTTDGETSEVSSISDSAGGNTWTKLKEWCNSQGANNGGATCSIWGSVLTNTIASGGTITANLANSKTAKCISAWEYTLGAGSTVSVAGSYVRSMENPAAPIAGVTGLPSAEYLAVTGHAVEDPYSSTTAAASYTAISQTNTTGQGGASNIGVGGQWTIQTATKFTANMTNGVAASCAIVVVALLETVSGTALTSNSSTVSPGSVVPSRSVSASGVSSTTAVGSVGPSQQISGNSVTASSGTVIPSTQIAASGVASTGSVGTTGVAASVAISGVEATGSVGTVTVETGLSVALTGVSATAAVDTPTVGSSVALLLLGP